VLDEREKRKRKRLEVEQLREKVLRLLQVRDVVNDLLPFMNCTDIIF